MNQARMCSPGRKGEPKCSRRCVSSQPGCKKGSRFVIFPHPPLYINQPFFSKCFKLEAIEILVKERREEEMCANVLCVCICGLLQE